MTTVSIERLGRDAAPGDVHDLALLLVDAIESGAGVSFLAGVTRQEAEAWWRSVLAPWPGRAILRAARSPHRRSARSRWLRAAPRQSSGPSSCSRRGRQTSRIGRMLRS